MNMIDQLLRLLFDGFGEIESISVSSYEGDTSLGWIAAEMDALRPIAYSHLQLGGADQRNARFAHVVFARAASLKSALVCADSTFFDS